jgi:N-acyl homoserine lactone hydrolase
MTDAVRDISVFSTGEVRVRPQNIAGTGSPALWWTFTSRQWSEPLPINVVLIKHERGAVLFDTGQSLESTTQPTYYPRGIVGLVYRRQTRFTVAPEQNLSAQLESRGVPVSSLAVAVLSHLHVDHAGGISQLAGVPVLVSAAELALLDAPRPEMHGVLARHIRVPGVELRGVEFAPTDDPAIADFDGAHDIHGDGTLVLLPTPGHSAGSMSLLVRRTDAAPLLLVGDVTYDPALLEAGVVPGTGEHRTQVDTARRINALAARLPGLVIVAAHDPGAAHRVALAGAGASDR